MPPREIPGFYFDEAKGKYFKIEGRATAPPTAHWAADNVKKRARHERERQKRKRGRPLASECPPIRRSPFAPGHCFVADALRLECEGVAGLARRKREVVGARARVWARGLDDAGTVILGEPVRRTSEFVVVTGDVERLGYIYVADRDNMGEVLSGGYIPTNHRGRTSFDAEETGITGYPVDSAADWLMGNHKLSALGYNPHKRVLFASYVPGRQGSHTPLLCMGTVDPLRPGPVVRSRLHLDYSLRDVPTRPGSAPIETYSTISTPHNSPSVCLLGTSSGAAVVHDSGTWDFLKPTRRHGAIFAVDCSHLDPNLVVAGGRRGIISTTDIRSHKPAGEFKHGTTATHLRVAPDGNEHRVIVAGVSNTMAIYDRRWPGRSQRALPLLTFPEYRNEARVRIGWDLCAEAGVVVAAEGNGAVAMYSVATGARVGELPLGDSSSEEDPVGCIRVARLGGEVAPSVFVGVERGVAKFSLGLVDDDSFGSSARGPGSSVFGG